MSVGRSVIRSLCPDIITLAFSLSHFFLHFFSSQKAKSFDRLFKDGRRLCWSKSAFHDAGDHTYFPSSDICRLQRRSVCQLLGLCLGCVFLCVGLLLHLSSCVCLFLRACISVCLSASICASICYHRLRLL